MSTKRWILLTPSFCGETWARRGGQFLRTPRQWFLPSAGLRSRLPLRKHTQCSRENSFPPGFLIHRSPRRAILAREKLGVGKRDGTRGRRSSGRTEEGIGSDRGTSRTPGGVRARSPVLGSQAAIFCLFKTSPRVLMITWLRGIFLPANSNPFLTIRGRPWQQGTSIVTTSIDLMPATLKMSANF